jgi:hypothetical protein
MASIFKKSILYWIPLPFIGVLNGIFRGIVLSNVTPETSARQISSILMIGWIALYTKLIFHKLELKRSAEPWILGITWIVLTMVFEFLVGIITNTSIHTMMADYNVFEGRLWGFVLMSLLVIPVLYFKSKVG